MFAGAATVLERHVHALNAINVFPVPDGDTGTNMHLTLDAATEQLGRTDGDLSQSAHALAHGALMGARGNSGVILSQVLRGLAEGLDGHHAASGPTLAGALRSASDAAYAALSEPVEGTILTVAREAAEAVQNKPPDSAEDVLATAVDAAKAAVARTPELLPVLKEAGVVDAGALGLAIILEGLLLSLRGRPLDVDLAPDIPREAGWQREAASLHRSEHGESGYCTEFVVAGEDIDPAAVRAKMETFGGSLLVVAGDGLLRVHVHTARPDDALAYGRTLGEVSHVKVENMEAQIDRFASAQAPEPVSADIGIVAVAAGAGIESAFRSVGVTHLVRGGQTMNPSAQEVLQAIDACPQKRIVVLPNNKNVIASAQQAAERSPKQVIVLPTRSIPQGVAAALALNTDLSFDGTIAAMEQAMASVRSAEVTRAVRATVIDGRRIEMGQAIGLIDGALQVVAGDVAEAARQCVEAMSFAGASLLTLYASEDVRDEDAEALAGELRETYPDLEVELIQGGQPHYPYLLALE